MKKSMESAATSLICVALHPNYFNFIIILNYNQIQENLAYD